MEAGRFYLTQRGINLMAYCYTGEPLVITRVEFGDGEIANEEELRLKIEDSMKATRKLIRKDGSKVVI